ncbi:MAG TPA: thiosulfate oxidation carrier complex protein SoxZ [Methylomirabilota bacterium]|nr:thiosulfate oxidation carrier complex protein SoxZ [Methylomirabilota bacterium]
MSDIGKVKIRIPGAIKAGDVIRARVLVLHPMEIVQRKDGKPVDKNYLFINRVIVSYAGREVGQFELTQSVSENPFFSFAVRVTEPGQLKVTFLDTHGGRYEGVADVKLS